MAFKTHTLIMSANTFTGQVDDPFTVTAVVVELTWCRASAEPPAERREVDELAGDELDELSLEWCLQDVCHLSVHIGVSHEILKRKILYKLL